MYSTFCTSPLLKPGDLQSYGLLEGWRYQGWIICWVGGLDDACHETATQRSRRTACETSCGIGDMGARRQVFAHLGRNIEKFTGMPVLKVPQAAETLATATFASRGGVNFA